MPSVATTISRWQPPMPLSLSLPLSQLLPTSTATPLLSMTLWWTARLTDCLTAWLCILQRILTDHPNPICSHSHSPICWSWPCWCWCWCCIDMQLTEPRDGFESGMGQLTQRDLFYRRMHFLWLNDSWSFLNAATAVNQPTNPRVIPSSLPSSPTSKIIEQLAAVSGEVPPKNKRRVRHRMARQKSIHSEYFKY